MSSVPPLLAYTESAQRGRKPARDAKGGKARRGAPPRRVPRGQKETGSFDDAARRELLTGFSKRKQQRKQAAHDFVQAKIREEIRATRQAAREARKERAAENVAAERAFYGHDDQDVDDDAEASAEPVHVEPLDRQQQYESDDRQAHVSVQALDLDEPFAESFSKPVRSAAPERKASKRKAAPAPARAPKVPSGSLTGILEPEVASAAQSEVLFDEDAAPAPPPSKKERHFTYTTAAERAQERERQRRKNHMHAERRRAENKARAQARAAKKPGKQRR